MKIGFLTGPFSNEPLEKVVEWASEAGFDALEVATSPGSKHIDPKVVLSGNKADQIKSLLKANKICFSSLAYYANPVDPEKGREVQDNLRMTIEAAAALGVDVVCTMAGFPYGEKTKMQVIEEDVAKVFPPLLEYAAKHKMKIAMENWFATLIQNLSHWDKIFEVVPHSNFGLNFDPSHLFWQEIDYLEAVERFGDRIFHTHAKDTEVKKYRLRYVGVHGDRWWRYCIPGYGGINWAEYIAALKAIKYDGVLSIEHEDELLGREEGMIKAKNHMAQFI